MTSTRSRRIVLALAFACSAGCSDSKHSNQQDAGTDAFVEPKCFTDPKTHDEIINACTTAQKIYKDSHPALLKADGSLPDLP